MVEDGERLAALEAKVDILLSTTHEIQKDTSAAKGHLAQQNGRLGKMEFALTQHEMDDHGHHDIRRDVDAIEQDGAFNRGQWSVLAAIAALGLAVGGAVGTALAAFLAN